MLGVLTTRFSVSYTKFGICPECGTHDMTIGVYVDELYFRCWSTACGWQSSGAITLDEAILQKLHVYVQELLVGECLDEEL